MVSEEDSSSVTANTLSAKHGDHRILKYHDIVVNAFGREITLFRVFCVYFALIMQSFVYTGADLAQVKYILARVKCILARVKYILARVKYILARVKYILAWANTEECL